MRHLASYIKVMRRYRFLCLSLALVACHKAPLPATSTSTGPAAPSVEDVLKELALRDLQNDIVLIKAQLAALTPLATAAVGKSSTVTVNIRPVQVSTTLYLCDRLAVASHELADDARAQPLLGEADALCAFQVPLAVGERRLFALESTRGADAPPKTLPPDCTPVRDALLRVGAKYKNDPKLAELIKRFKIDCPRLRLASAARPERAVASAGSTVDLSAQQNACRKRCDDASFRCRAGCQYCGSCTSDKTWEWCNATCNNCRQGCEQNERFCQASCGGS
jgi:hypothetical protein